MKTGQRVGVGVILVGACVAFGACGTDSGDLFGIAPDDIVFLRQTVQPGVVMDALFEGRVVLDAAGCPRLDSPDPATVVWPAGFTLAGNGLTVRNGAGREIGRLSGAFRLGGGEVESLHEGIALTASDRQRAIDRCPGRFWIVGDVLTD